MRTPNIIDRSNDELMKEARVKQAIINERKKNPESLSERTTREVKENKEAAKIIRDYGW